MKSIAQPKYVLAFILLASCEEARTAGALTFSIVSGTPILEKLDDTSVRAAFELRNEGESDICLTDLSVAVKARGYPVGVELFESSTNSPEGPNLEAVLFIPAGKSSRFEMREDLKRPEDIEEFQVLGGTVEEAQQFNEVLTSIALGEEFAFSLQYVFSECAKTGQSDPLGTVEAVPRDSIARDRSTQQSVDFQLGNLFLGWG